MYFVIGWSKHIEEDTYENGCLPCTGFGTNGNDYFQNSDARNLIHQLMDFCGTSNEENVIVNACGTPGRVDIQVLEDANCVEATESDMELWREGKKRLYLSTYMFNVQQMVNQAPTLFAGAKQVGGFNLE